MNLLLSLTLSGSLLFLLVWWLDRRFSSSMTGRWRRFWWILVTVGFLVPSPVAMEAPAWAQEWTRSLSSRLDFGEPTPAPAADDATMADPLPPAPFADFISTLPSSPLDWPRLALIVWAIGANLLLLLTVVATVRTASRWRGERLSTDTRLLELLENAKKNAKVSIPIGLVVTDKVTTPALLGWLRPRLLLPRSYAETMAPETLDAIFLHELAHLRAGDLLIGWLFTLVRALHWFNPLAHLSARAWSRFREEAADGDAIRWLQTKHPNASEIYGDALVAALRHARRPKFPGGALALGETAQSLKQRMTMILQSSNRSTRPIVGFLVTFCLVIGVNLQFSQAKDPDATSSSGYATIDKQHHEAIASMEQWLQTVDRGEYEKSWKQSSAYFKSKVTLKQWLAALKEVRQPLGALRNRSAVSALPQEVVEDIDSLTVQFDTSFANLKYAVETVTFNHEPDGQWRVSGYFIKPR